MPFRAPSGAVTLVALSLVGTGALGAAVGIALTRPVTPATLADAAQVRSVTVTQRAYDDARTVEVTLTQGPVRALVAPVSGRVTESTCALGAPLEPGASVVAIDGVPVLDLATAVPLWRDLKVGDHGSDVRALHVELARLGRDVPDDDVVAERTVRAVSGLLESIGAPALPAGAIPMSGIAWLPEADAPAATCRMIVGTAVGAGDQLVTLPTSLTAAAVSRLPDDAVDGARALLIDGQAVPVDPAGAVSGAKELTVIATSAAYRQAVLLAPDAPTLAASWVLTEPLTVTVVPPSAVFAIEGNEGCVAVDGAPHRVTIVGSELGQTFLTVTDGETLTTVELHPDASAACG